MTLKQFLQLAAGALVSLMLYASPLNPVLKWPLIILSFLFGVALAFLPIEERPLSTWIFIFFRSIYSPTKFVWKKLDPSYSFFTTEEAMKKSSTAAVSPQIATTKIEEPVTNPVPQHTFVVNLEEKEKVFLNKVEKGFIAPNSTVVINDPSVLAPTISFQGPTGVENTEAILMTINASEKIPPQKITTTSLQGVSSIPKNSPIGLPLHAGYTMPQNQTGIQDSQYTSTFQQTPQIQTTPILTQNTSSQSSVPTKMAQFSPEASPPLVPNKPNVISGQVLDLEGHIIDGAIIEVKDESGRPVRALKSNKLGHFMTVTPLLDGKYVILSEKDGYEFEPVSFNAVNSIIPPIAIRGKSLSLSHGSVDVSGSIN